MLSNERATGRDLEVRGRTTNAHRLRKGGTPYGQPSLSANDRIPRGGEVHDPQAIPGFALSLSTQRGRIPHPYPSRIGRGGDDQRVNDMRYPARNALERPTTPP